jgi:hypothetical protein
LYKLGRSRRSRSWVPGCSISVKTGGRILGPAFRRVRKVSRQCYSPATLLSYEGYCRALLWAFRDSHPYGTQLYEGLIAIKHGSTAQHPAEKCNPAQLPPLHTIGSCAAHPACEQICLADQASMSPDICMDRPFARVALPAVALLRRYLRWVTPRRCTHGPRTRASRDALLVHRVATSHIPCDAWRTSSLSRTDIAV